MHTTQRFGKDLQDSTKSKKDLVEDADTISVFADAVSIIIDRYKRGGRLYIPGNGGSAADAQHLATEIVSKLARDRAPLSAKALTLDLSILTAIGNDYGYYVVFSRQLEGKATKNNVFLGITTSGNSLNIVKAIEKCH